MTTKEKPSFGLGKSAARDRYIKIYAQEIAKDPTYLQAQAEFKAGSAEITTLRKMEGLTGKSLLDYQGADGRRGMRALLLEARNARQPIAQDAQPAEIIVVNDGCPDSENLEIVLAPYREAGRIRYVKQNNKGVSAARNTGIGLAATPFVLVVDSDDILEPKCLSSLYEMFVSDPEYVLVYAYPVYFGDSKIAGKRGTDLFPARPGNTATFRDLVTRQTYASPVGIFRRQVALYIGGYPEFLRIAEDYNFQLRMCRAGKVGYILEPTLYRCRIRPGSAMRSREVVNWRALALENLLTVPDLTAEELQMLKAEIAYQKADNAFYNGRFEFAYGDQAKGIQLMTEANAYFRSARTAAILKVCRLFPGLMRAAARWRDRGNPH